MRLFFLIRVVALALTFLHLNYFAHSNRRQRVRSGSLIFTFSGASIAYFFGATFLFAAGQRLHVTPNAAANFLSAQKKGNPQEFLFAAVLYHSRLPVDILDAAVVVNIAAAAVDFEIVGHCRRRDGRFSNAASRVPRPDGFADADDGVFEKPEDFRAKIRRKWRRGEILRERLRRSSRGRHSRPSPGRNATPSSSSPSSWTSSS